MLLLVQGNKSNTRVQYYAANSKNLPYDVESYKVNKYIIKGYLYSHFYECCEGYVVKFIKSLKRREREIPFHFETIARARLAFSLCESQRFCETRADV